MHLKKRLTVQKREIKPKSKHCNSYIIVIVIIVLIIVSIIKILLLFFGSIDALIEEMEENI
jgi:hypothetical protein